MLLVGFGALLAAMAIICFDSLLTVQRFQSSNAQIRQDFFSRESILDRVRTDLYESSNLVRDYAESSAEKRQALVAALETIRKNVTAEVQASVQSLPEANKADFQRLDAELAKYWATVASIVDLGEAEDHTRRTQAISTDLNSQHAEILAITREISAVNEDELKQTELKIASVSAQFRRRLLLVASVALGFGFILAAGTVIYAGRLEKNVEEKYRESLGAQRELKQLSKRLVDAEERERRAISRELHDEVGQSLSALLLDIRNMTETITDEASLQRLQNIKTLAENCLNEVRDMALLLRPSMLDDLGLVPALEWQAREVSKRTGMLVDSVNENVPDDLPDEYRTCVYRIVQEALSNCSKHAYAKKVRVLVRQESNHLRVSIEDDGKGFEARRIRGLGLVGMNERVSQLGGVLKVESNMGQGTRLEVDLPLGAPSAALPEIVS